MRRTVGKISPFCTLVLLVACGSQELQLRQGAAPTLAWQQLLAATSVQDATPAESPDGKADTPPELVDEVQPHQPRETQHPRATPTPQRPGFSANTQTTAEGTWELEAGYQRNSNRLRGYPLTLKYGLDDRREIFGGLIAQARVRRSRMGTGRGQGDLLLGFRERASTPINAQDGSLIQASWAAAVQLPTGSDNVRGGHEEVNVFASTSLDASLSGFDWTFYYELGLLGTDGTFDLMSQHLLALALSAPLEGEVSAFGELAYVAPSSKDNTLFGVIGLSMPTASGSVWDLSVQDGITGQRADTQIALGVTHNFGSWGDSEADEP